MRRLKCVRGALSLPKSTLIYKQQYHCLLQAQTLFNVSFISSTIVFSEGDSISLFKDLSFLTPHITPPHYLSVTTTQLYTLQ